MHKIIVFISSDGREIHLSSTKQFIGFRNETVSVPPAPQREVYKTTAYFDIEKGGWRSLRWESIVKVF